MFLPLALQGIYPPNPSLEQFKSNLETLSHFNALNTTENMKTHTHTDTYRGKHKGTGQQNVLLLIVQHLILD